MLVVWRISVSLVAVAALTLAIVLLLTRPAGQNTDLTNGSAELVVKSVVADSVTGNDVVRAPVVKAVVHNLVPAEQQAQEGWIAKPLAAVKNVPTDVKYGSLVWADNALNVGLDTSKYNASVPGLSDFSQLQGKPWVASG